LEQISEGRWRDDDLTGESLPCGVLGGDALLIEMGFEIGLEGEQGVGFAGGAEGGLGVADFDHLFEVRDVVGADEEDAAGLQGACGETGEAVVDEAAFPVPALGPWIREIDMDRREGSGRDHPFEHIGRFEAQYAEITQAEAASLAINLAEATEQTFDSDEVVFRILGGVAQQEGSVTGPEFEFDGGAGSEEGGKIEALEDVGREDDRIRDGRDG